MRKNFFKSAVGVIMASLMLFPGGITASAEEIATQTDSYIAYEQQPGVPKTGALDYSWLNECPAGTHGHVVQDGENLKFEDGTPVKFFGVVIGFGAATPSKEVAEAYASELASSGVNFVRLHAIDCTYSGILSYSDTEKTVMNPDMLDRMDYLVHCLKEKGIYIHLDTNAGRVLKTADGFTEEEAADKINGALRAAHFFDDKVIELEQNFMIELLSHQNPYTGMSYAEDPVIAVIQYANESSITWFDNPRAKNAFTDELKAKYNEWLLKKYQNRDALKEAWTNDNGKCALKDREDPALGTVACSPLGSWGEALVNFKTSFSNTDCSPRHADFTSFLIDTQANTFNTAYKKIRELGYKSLINCSNQPERAADLYLNSLGDVMEKNIYLNSPLSGYTVPSSFAMNEMASIDPHVINEGDTSNSHSVGLINRVSVAGKPLIVTEWNVTSPTDFKADAIFQMAAYGAFQGWDGFCLFIYTFDGENSFFSINGYTDFFTSCIDPASYAQIGLAAMIFRCGIVQEAKNTVEVVMTPSDILAQNYDFAKAPQCISYVSKFSYRFTDGIYDGDADLVIPSGNTASGDYTSAKHLLMLSENIYSDAYNKVKGRTEWYNMHIQPDSEKTKIGNLDFNIGKTAAVASNENITSGGFYSSDTDFDIVFDNVMKRFGLLDEDKGYHGSDIITDTGEITYSINKNFRLETERAAVFAGNTLHKADGNSFGGCTLITENDRAAVAVVSTDGTKSIKDASSLNVYAMGRSTNTGLTYDITSSSKKLVTSLGTGPILYEDIRGTLRIPTSAAKCTVYGLDSLGNRVNEVSASAVDGGFEIAVGGYVQYEVLMSDSVDEAESTSSSDILAGETDESSAEISEESIAGSSDDTLNPSANTAPVIIAAIISAGALLIAAAVFIAVRIKKQKKE